MNKKYISVCSLFLLLLLSFQTKVLAKVLIEDNFDDGIIDSSMWYQLYGMPWIESDGYLTTPTNTQGLPGTYNYLLKKNDSFGNFEATFDMRIRTNSFSQEMRGFDFRASEDANHNNQLDETYQIMFRDYKPYPSLPIETKKVELERASVSQGNSSLSTISPSELTVNQWNTVKVRAQGENLQMKIWEKNLPEPQAWDIEVQDNAIQSGRIGFLNHAQSIADFDNLKVESIGDGKKEIDALLIGAGDYWSPITWDSLDSSSNDLDGAVLNAQRLEAVLKTYYTADVVTIKDASGDKPGDEKISPETIESAIKTQLSKADADDLSIFYYSGHGGENLGESEIQVNAAETVSGSTLNSWLNKYTDGNVIVVVDSCHSGSAIDSLKGATNRWVMTSTKSNETFLMNNLPDLGGSAFTYWLADGLSGGHINTLLWDSPDLNHDGKIMLNEAFKYAYEKTTSLSLLQNTTPQLDPTTEDMLLAETKDLDTTFHPFTLLLNSPADFIITDPQGHILSKDSNGIGYNSFYFEGDLFGDGHVHDLATILNALEGKYQITVVPQLGDELSGTFSLEAYYGGQKIILADNKFIDLNSRFLYEFDSEKLTVTPEPPTILLYLIGFAALAGERLRRKIVQL